MVLAHDGIAAVIAGDHARGHGKRAALHLLRCIAAMRTLETVDRALQLLLAFEADEGRELTVAAIAGRLGIHRSSASRFAATLAERGFLERAPGSDTYRLGPAMARLGLLALTQRGVVAAAREPMDRLAESTGETAVLSVPHGDESVCVLQVDGSHLIGPRDWVGRRSPLPVSSDGKVFLAFARPGDDAWSLVRQRGWATSEGELEPGLHGVAAPVFDAYGRCVAALSVSGPAYRLSRERLEGLGRQVVTAAGEVSVRLGAGRKS